ncbi:MAG: FAD-dependent oxidoreductase, partial [Kangiellaceae bacterium]|nr:FAD-dependent oxidoreductase [Kangiellaceae bacterium]
MEFKTEISRRKFLLKSSDVVKSTAALQTISALSLSLSTLACSSSSASSQDNTSIDQPNLLNPSPIPSDWPANVGKGKTVIILGGGVSGLVCAYEMERLGYECTVIEASERLGGRVRTIRGGDEVTELDSSQTCQFESNPALYFNAGAARIPHHHQLILGYCRMFSIALEPFINENTGAR